MREMEAEIARLNEEVDDLHDGVRRGGIPGCGGRSGGLSRVVRATCSMSSSMVGARHVRMPGRRGPTLARRCGTVRRPGTRRCGTACRSCKRSTTNPRDPRACRHHWRWEKLAFSRLRGSSVPMIAFPPTVCCSVNWLFSAVTGFSYRWEMGESL